MFDKTKYDRTCPIAGTLTGAGGEGFAGGTGNTWTMAGRALVLGSARMESRQDEYPGIGGPKQMEADGARKLGQTG